MTSQSIDWAQSVLQLGAAGILLLGFVAIFRGWLRTAQEIEVWQRLADQAQSESAELREAVKDLTTAVTAGFQSLRDRICAAFETLEDELGGDEARAKIQEVFGAGSAGVPPASGKRAAGGTPALPGFCDVPGLCKAATL